MAKSQLGADDWRSPPLAEAATRPGAGYVATHRLNLDLGQQKALELARYFFLNLSTNRLSPGLGRAIHKLQTPTHRFIHRGRLR